MLETRSLPGAGILILIEIAPVSLCVIHIVIARGQGFMAVN